MGRPFFIYMLLCADGSYYVGHTDHLEERIAEHQEGGKCAYTSVRRPVQLVWAQDFQTREEAKEAELRIKPWSRAKKLALIRGDIAALKTAAKKKDWTGYRTRRDLKG